jgi:hypothetical protein
VTGADEQLEHTQARAIAQGRQGIGRRLLALLGASNHVIYLYH